MEADQTQGSGGSGRTADDIDGDFVPKVRVDVAAIEIDGETVVLEGERLSVQHLDRVATIVWTFFDGTVTLDELATDLSEVFEADPDVVRADVLKLTQELGRRGILEGIDADPPPPARTFEAPTGVPIGGRLPSFRQPDLDGRAVALDDLAGQRMLIINWSPTCGHCIRIAPDLAALEPALASASVRLVLLAHGSVEANRDLVASSGLTCLVLVRDGDLGDDEPFPGMGTPIGYVLDETLAVDAPLVVGGVDVPEVARMLADGGAAL